MENGIKSKREMFSREKALKEVLEAEINETNRSKMEIIVRQIKSISEDIRKIGEKIKEKGKGLKGQKNLQSITGVGESNA